MTRIFVSYSGRLGYKVGATVNDWLKRVAQAEVWLAPQDMPPGKMWIDTLSSQLQKTDRAILCMTRDSLRAPWTHFEAGAAFKGLGASRIIPYLLNLSPKRLTEPLRMFQAVQADREGTLKLLEALDLVVTQEVFDEEWPRLERDLTRIRHQANRWRNCLLASVFGTLLLLAGYGWYLKSTSIFPDFEPAVERPNTANAAPLAVRYRPCGVEPEGCPRGYYYSFDAALSGGYATRWLDRWVPMSLQGSQVLSSIRFRTGSHTLELGLTDSGGNAAFFDCRSNAVAVLFSAPLNPKETRSWWQK